MTSSISTKARWSIQCPTALSSDTFPSLIVTAATDGTRYLFSACPENLVRACTQDRIPLRRLKGVFLSSSVDLQTTSGLGGLLLSLGERQGAELEIHGPEGTDHLLASMRYHTRRQKLSLRLHQISRPLAGHAGISDGTNGDLEHEAGEMEEKPAFQDANLTVWAEPVLPEGWTTSTGSESESDTRPGRRRRRSSPSLSQEETARKNGRRSESPAALQEGSNTGKLEEKAELDWFARSFSPATLTGSQASTWRSMVISDMFRSGNLYVSQPSKDRWLPSPAWNHVPLPECRAPPIAVSYLVVGPKVRGQFLPEEAKRQGVKPGPDFARITAREEVLLPDGTPVDLDKCFTPGAPAACFALIYCPSKEYIPTMLARNPLRKLTADMELTHMFHVLGPGVLEDEAYINWLSFLPRSIQHIVSAPGYTADRITFASATILQLRLSRMDSGIFRLPAYDLEPQKKLTDLSGLLQNVKPLEMGDIFYPRGAPRGADEQPTRARTFDFLPESEEAQIAQAKLTGVTTEAAKMHSKETWDEYLRLTKEAQAAVQEEEASRSARGTDGGPGSETQVIPLGTGSAMPSKYRNVSSTVLVFEHGQIALLDAGEGTSGQLARHYGQSGLKDFYQRLSFIFISHMHADHHSGLAAVLEARVRAVNTLDQSHEDAQELSKTLYIACPPQVRTYIRDMGAVHDLGLDRKDAPIAFIDSHDLLPNTRRPDEKVKDLCGQSHLRLKQVETVLVEHRTKAFGLVLEGEAGWKIVYSGDTQPCRALVQAGQGATLLIHEATIEDDLPEVAASKGHSTFAQAIQVAKDMRAKHCLLTHFSQRYPKFPPLSDAEDDKSPDACHVSVAFDLMSLKIGDFWKFRHFVKPFEVLFSEMEADDGNDGTGAAAVEDEIVAPGKEQAGQKKKTMDTKPKGKQAAKLNQQKQKEQAVMVRKEKKGKQSNGSAAAGTPVA